MERGVSHSGGGSGGNVLLGNLFRVTVKEHVDHDIPLLVTLHGAAETQNLTAEHPVHETDGGAALVVGGDGNINILKGRVAVAEGNHGDVGGSSLTNGLKMRGERKVLQQANMRRSECCEKKHLVVSARVSDDDETGLHELLGDLVREGTGGVAVGQVLRSSVLSVLEDGAGAERASADDADVSGILNGHDDAGSQSKLLPERGKVHDVNTVGTALEGVARHLRLKVLGADMDVGREHLDDVISGGAQGGGHVAKRARH